MTPKTRWKTEFCRLLSYRQSFVKSIGVFPGPWSILLKKHPVLKELSRVMCVSRVASVEILMSVERVAQVKRIAPVTKVFIVRLSSIARVVSIAFVETIAPVGRIMSVVQDRKSSIALKKSLLFFLFFLF